MPMSAMTDEEGAEARKWKKKRTRTKRKVWKQEKKKFLKKYGSQEAWEAKLRKRRKLAGTIKNSNSFRRKRRIKPCLLLAHMDTHYGEIEESAKNLSKARKEVMEELLEEREAWLEQRQGWFRKMLRSGAFKRFVNYQLQLSERPVFEHGTERNPRKLRRTGFYKLLDVGRVNKIVFGRKQKATAKSNAWAQPGRVFRIAVRRTHRRRRYCNLDRTREASLSRYRTLVSIRFGGSSATEFSAMCPLLIVAMCYQMLNEIYRADEAEDQFANIHARQYSPEKSSMENRNTSLDDIAGIEALKEEMYELIRFLRDFQKFKDVGAAVPGGILLSGPPNWRKRYWPAALLVKPAFRSSPSPPQSSPICLSALASVMMRNLLSA